MISQHQAHVIDSSHVDEIPSKQQRVPERVKKPGESVWTAKPCVFNSNAVRRLIHIEGCAAEWGGESDTPHCRHQSSLQPSRTHLLHASGCDMAASRHPRGFCLPSRTQLHAALLHRRLDPRQELGTRPRPAQDCGVSLISASAGRLVNTKVPSELHRLSGCSISGHPLQACQILLHPSLQHCAGPRACTLHGTWPTTSVVAWMCSKRNSAGAHMRRVPTDAAYR